MSLSANRIPLRRDMRWASARSPFKVFLNRLGVFEAIHQCIHDAAGRKADRENGDGNG
jgi:hypothetical protein